MIYLSFNHPFCSSYESRFNPTIEYSNLYADKMNYVLTT